MRSARITQSRWIAARPPARSSDEVDTPTAGYRASDRKWWLWWPCRECDGVVLPLLFAPRLYNGSFAFDPLAAQLRTRSCPACETRRRRARGASPAPAVWYDTVLCDWVVQLADGHGGAAILPLEIGWFDAPEATVYRAASDIAHSGEGLEG